MNNQTYCTLSDTKQLENTLLRNDTKGKKRDKIMILRLVEKLKVKSTRWSYSKPKT